MFEKPLLGKHSHKCGQSSHTNIKVGGIIWITHVYISTITYNQMYLPKVTLNISYSGWFSRYSCT